MIRARRAAILAMTAVAIVGLIGTFIPTAASASRVLRTATGAVYGGDFADPSIMLVGNRYYAYATQSGHDNIQVVWSKDLLHWSARSDALPVLPSWATSGFTWAPSVTSNPSGGYEMFYVARDGALGVQCIGRAVSTSPLGPFVDAGSAPYLCQTALGGSIDPFVFVDNGTDYLLWKSDGANGMPQEVWAQQLGSGDRSLEGTAALLLSATSKWEDGIVEGPAMIRTGSGLYLYFSGNRWSTSEYAIGIAGCDTPLGPCVSSSTGQQVSTEPGVEGPGGPTFFVAKDGQLMMAYAAWTDDPGLPTGRRELYVDSVDTAATVPSLIDYLVPQRGRSHSSG